MRSKAGVALITVLLFMQIWIILGLLALSLVWTSQRLNAHFFQKQKMEAFHSIILNEIEKNITSASCVTEPLLTTELINKSKEWWQTEGCAGKNYFYVIEELALDSCAYILSHPDYIASYFRVSALFNEMDSVILQSTIAMPILKSAALEACKTHLHGVEEGKQMTRILNKSYSLL